MGVLTEQLAATKLAVSYVREAGQRLRITLSKRDGKKAKHVSEGNRSHRRE